MFTRASGLENTDRRQEVDQGSLNSPEDMEDREVDLLHKLHSNLEQLEELVGRLSFSVREISQLLKINRF